MSNRLFQSVMFQMKDVVNRVIGVIDENGLVIACSELGKIGESKQRIKDELAISGSSIVFDGYTYRFLASQNAARNDAIVFVEGDDELAGRTSQILAVTLGNIKSLYDEKYDRASFIKSIILDNILPSDIYTKSSELHFSGDEHRAVFIIKLQSPTKEPAHELIQALFPDTAKDYVININEQDTVVVKELDDDADAEAVDALARDVYATMAKQHGIKTLIGISSVVDSLKDLARAYKEARISLEVGKVFDIEKPVMSYENLGIGRLVYQLPTTLCDIFLQEVFKKGSLESLDRETLMTVQSFFENNLNVSETSRKLFVHRNTLVYRLEKIRKLTGLDLREFDHAVTFKVALMVKKYLTSKPTKF